MSFWKKLVGGSDAPPPKAKPATQATQVTSAGSAPPAASPAVIILPDAIMDQITQLAKQGLSATSNLEVVIDLEGSGRLRDALPHAVVAFGQDCTAASSFRAAYICYKLVMAAAKGNNISFDDEMYLL